MNKIKVKILDHNLNGMPLFLAKLTQRGHKITSMADLEDLYNENIDKIPSKYLLALPHSTLKRMNYITIAIVGLSTKCVSQLRTHATRLTFISTSTQYSSYENREDNYVIPDSTSEKLMRNGYRLLEEQYKLALDNGVDKDIAGYLLPQSLRKALIISGNLDAWSYVIKTRLCNRNTKETQYVVRLIYNAIKEYGEEYVEGMLPPCVNGKCQEGKFCCGKKFKL